jgi:hypothetical protein
MKTDGTLNIDGEQRTAPTCHNQKTTILSLIGENSWLHAADLP